MQLCTEINKYIKFKALEFSHGSKPSLQSQSREAARATYIRSCMGTSNLLVLTKHQRNNNIVFHASCLKELELLKFKYFLTTLLSRKPF